MTTLAVVQEEWPDLITITNKIQEKELVSNEEWEDLFAQANSFEKYYQIYTGIESNESCSQWREKAYEGMENSPNKTTEQEEILATMSRVRKIMSIQS